ncbi:MAG: RNA-binding S4 domain-containing protein [Nitrospirota bacterium]|nr:RNA-binding S4 domain-containing protein [Nitrospirota bacterium]
MDEQAGGRLDTSAMEFRLEGKEFVELNDLLKLSGLFNSGGMAKTAITEGLVTVDGRVELRRRCKVRAGQVVGYGDRRIKVK